MCLLCDIRFSMLTYFFPIRRVSQSRTWSPEWSRHHCITSLKTSLTWDMTALLPNVSVPGSTAALLVTTDCPFNLTAAAQAGLGSGHSLAPLCTVCCCGVLNRTLAVVFMVSLAFAIVVGNVVTLTVFVQTRQSRTPQGYLKGKCCELCVETTFVVILCYINNIYWIELKNNNWTALSPHLNMYI